MIQYTQHRGFPMGFYQFSNGKEGVLLLIRPCTFSKVTATKGQDFHFEIEWSPHSDDLLSQHEHQRHFQGGIWAWLHLSANCCTNQFLAWIKNVCQRLHHRLRRCHTLAYFAILWPTLTQGSTIVQELEGRWSATVCILCDSSCKVLSAVMETGKVL